MDRPNNSSYPHSSYSHQVTHPMLLDIDSTSSGAMVSSGFNPPATSSSGSKKKRAGERSGGGASGSNNMEKSSAAAAKVKGKPGASGRGRVAGQANHYSAEDAKNLMGSSPSAPAPMDEAALEEQWFKEQLNKVLRCKRQKLLECSDVKDILQGRVPLRPSTSRSASGGAGGGAITKRVTKKLPVPTGSRGK